MTHRKGQKSIKNNNNKYTEKKPETWKQSRYSNWNNFQHGSAFLFLIALLHHLRSVDISQEPCEDGRICDRLFHLLCIPWPESYRHLILLVSLKRQWDWPGKDRNRTKSPFLSVYSPRLVPPRKNHGLNFRHSFLLNIYIIQICLHCFLVLQHIVTDTLLSGPNRHWKRPCKA